MGNFKEDILNIKAFVFDCDGVFTNGSIGTSSSGETIRTYNVKDGYAVSIAVKRGYPVCIISGGMGDSISYRFNNLGVFDIHLSCIDKRSAFNEFMQKYSLKSSETMYMGDDVPDIMPMSMSGIAACPNDAVLEVKDISKYISPYKGGEGCVRDVIEQVLKAQRQWNKTNNKDVASR